MIRDLVLLKNSFLEDRTRELEIRSLLQSFFFADGTTPLCAASLWNKFEMVQLLIESGADVNAENSGAFCGCVFVSPPLVQYNHKRYFLRCRHWLDCSTCCRLSRTWQSCQISPWKWSWYFLCWSDHCLHFILVLLSVLKLVCNTWCAFCACLSSFYTCPFSVDLLSQFLHWSQTPRKPIAMAELLRTMLRSPKAYGPSFKWKDARKAANLIW